MSEARRPFLMIFLARAFRRTLDDQNTTQFCAGVGAGFKPPRWLLPGDSVTIWVEGVGTLENPIQ